MKIIDISSHNGNVDFKKVISQRIDGVIIRAGYGKIISQKDKLFDVNYKNAKANNLNVGAYWYSYASDADEARLEALKFLDVIKNKTFELPLYLDIEENKQVKLGKTICTKIAEAFCQTLENAGYFCGIYSFDSFFTTNLDKSIPQKYSLWIARTDGKKPQSYAVYDMWQYSWKEKIPEHTCDFDISKCYRNFPEIIKNAGLNGFKKTDTYSVTAEINGIDFPKADKIKTACLELSMNVKQIKE